MNDLTTFSLEFWDYFAFGLYFVVLCAIGFWVGRKEKAASEDYFLAGRRLPWYVVGTSFVASNISTEHFIGMVGAAYVYGICIAQWEWGNITSFTILIWFFIPFLLATRVFTAPEFMEKRYSAFLRVFFAVVTVISNVVAFLAAVLYGGGLALHALFGWSLWFSIIALAVVAGSWAIYGGLASVAWTDFFTMIVMLAGGIMVTVLGLYMVSGDAHSLIDGLRATLDANYARDGVWAEAVAKTAQHIVQRDTYDRMAVFQPASHQVAPWPSIVFSFLTISIWYNVINQFMIQRVLAAKNQYHARMGIVLAGYLKVLMPFIVVVPGLILFATRPEVMSLPWDEIRPEADKGYVHLLQALIPAGLRGVFLAALFGSIQSTVNSVLNSTSTIFTLDIYKRLFNKNASDKHYVVVGMWTTGFFLVLSIVLAGYIEKLGGSLFVYIQSLYAFFAPPFAAVFLLGILLRRINAWGANVTVVAGFAFGILMKVYVQFVPSHLAIVEPFGNQALFNWIFCVITCITVSLLTPRPRPDQVDDTVTINWRRLNIFQGLGDRWYTSVVLWWGGFAVLLVALIVGFSGLFS
ncbi:MAG TPA: sodium/solute symporter [Candidatus Hydrogenedentes bacterium]|nr:sodium/solute symporter [Candidatus Hydrogenedentota bacterium]HPG68423.1 sodium/solute symporter [Candidatus Hydrogenedentota bacterium]